jgi:hypothetical protein
MSYLNKLSFIYCYLVNSFLIVSFLSTFIISSAHFYKYNWNEVNSIPRDLTEQYKSKYGQPYLSEQRVYFKKNQTVCSMFEKKCYIEIFLKNKDLLSFLRIISENVKISDFRSITSCKGLSNEYKCSTIQEFLRNEEIYLYPNYDILLIKVDSKIVGKTNFIFQVIKNEVYIEAEYKHNVIITSPDRFIDLFQQIFIGVFSIIISIIMGILLDTNTLVRVIKTPIPVVIGFIAQYLFMPMVKPTLFKT